MAATQERGNVRELLDTADHALVQKSASVTKLD